MFEAVKRFFSTDTAQAYKNQRLSQLIPTASHQRGSLSCATVYRCVDIISSTIASLPIRIYKIDKNGNHSIDKSHRLNRIFERPNEWQTGTDLRMHVLAGMILNGNAYVKVIGVGGLMELVPLLNDEVSVSFDYARKKIIYYVSANPDEKADKRGEVMGDEAMRNLIHFRGLSINGYEGLSVLRLAKASVNYSLFAENFGAKMYKNRLNPDGVIEIPKELPDDKMEALLESLKEMRKASGEGTVIPILEDGAQWKTISIAPDDAEFLESRKFQRNEIAMFFGVPPHLLGDVEKSTSWGAGIEAQNQGFITYTLQKWMTLFESALNRTLLANDDMHFIKHDTAGLLRGNNKERSLFYERLIKMGVFTPNEVREMEGLPPHPDGNELYKPPGSPNQNKPAAENDGGDM